jgi:hypothetical protein
VGHVDEDEAFQRGALGERHLLERQGRPGAELPLVEQLGREGGDLSSSG